MIMLGSVGNYFCAGIKGLIRDSQPGQAYDQTNKTIDNCKQVCKDAAQNVFDNVKDYVDNSRPVKTYKVTKKWGKDVKELTTDAVKYGIAQGKQSKPVKVASKVAGGVKTVAGGVKQGAKAVNGGVKKGATLYTKAVDTGCLAAKYVYRAGAETLGAVGGKAKEVYGNGIIGGVTKTVAWSLGLNNYGDAIGSVKNAYKSLGEIDIRNRLDIVSKQKSKIRSKLEVIQLKYKQAEIGPGKEAYRNRYSSLLKVFNELETESNSLLEVSEKIRLEDRKKKLPKLIADTEENIKVAKGLAKTGDPLAQRDLILQKVKLKEYEEEAKGIDARLSLIPKTFTDNMSEAGSHAFTGISKASTIIGGASTYVSATVSNSLGLGAVSYADGAAKMIAYGINSTVTYGVSKAYELGGSALTAVASNPGALVAQGLSTAIEVGKIGAVVGGTTMFGYKAAESYIAACESDSWLGTIGNGIGAVGYGTAALTVPALSLYSRFA